MKIIIDRFEGIYAICEKEDKTMMDIKRINLPKGVKEDDVINIEGSIITIDLEETAKRKVDIEKLTEDLWE